MVRRQRIVPAAPAATTGDFLPLGTGAALGASKGGEGRCLELESNDPKALKAKGIAESPSTFPHQKQFLHICSGPRRWPSPPACRRWEGYTSMGTPHLLSLLVWSPALGPKCLSKQWEQLRPREGRSRFALWCTYKARSLAAWAWPRPPPSHFGSRQTSEEKGDREQCSGSSWESI